MVRGVVTRGVTTLPRGLHLLDSSPVPPVLPANPFGLADLGLLLLFLVFPFSIYFSFVATFLSTFPVAIGDVTSSLLCR
jgi:hypothetical protein